MEIDTIVQNVLYRFPLLGNVLVNLKFQHTNQSVPAPAFTDGQTVYFRDEFFEEYSLEEQEFILSHEIFHIILRHFSRNVGRDPDLLNYVEDAIINQLLVQNGMKMPPGLVDVEDALQYSVEELYMKYLPNITSIQKWMQDNTYHADFIVAVSSDYDFHNLEDFFHQNHQIQTEMLEDFKQKMKYDMDQAKENLGVGRHEGGIDFYLGYIGNSRSILNWKQLLYDTLKVPDDDETALYEVEMDGIIRREVRHNEVVSNTEIVIDSSGSMRLSTIKTILRECKNILATAPIKVGFCDTVFYGWNDIRSEADIDELHMVGRGGTDFSVMAHSFSPSIVNKLVITDGFGIFPNDAEDVLWVVFGYALPPSLNEKKSLFYPKSDLTKIHYIFVDENELDAKEYTYAKTKIN